MKNEKASTGARCKLSSFLKAVALSLVLASGPSIAAAETGDLRVPLRLGSRFTLRTEEGPPANRNGLYKFASCYLFKYNSVKYHREISFTPTGDYISLRDFYGDYRLPSYQTLRTSNFVDFRSRYAVNTSWQVDLKQELTKKSRDEEGKSTVDIHLPELPGAMRGIVGEQRSKITVTGSRSISFSGRSEWEDNLVNTGTFKQSKFPTLQMEQKSRFKVTGTIGSKITVEVDQDSQRDTELANTIKLRYKGEDDEILQTIEAGNTNLALPNSQLIGYSQNIQGLFGIKSTAKIGNLDLTVITSQEKGTSEKANFNAGAQGRERPIKDCEYLAYTYFWLDDLPHGPEDTLVSVELYNGGTYPANPMGIATVNPDTTPNLTSEYEYTAFAALDRDQFEVFRQGWYVVLNQPLSSNNVLGAYIKYTRYDPGANRSDTIQVGNLSYRPGNTINTDTTFVLRLLKHRNPNSTYATWNRMWRNVYDLGTRNISSDGFVLKIYKGNGVIATDLEDQDSHCFITLLELDKLNNVTNAPGPDCVFDFNNTVLDISRGHLIFPRRFPFISDSLIVTNPTIYNLPREASNQDDSSKYYIYVKTAQRSSTFQLGRANIMPGSEVVRLGDGTVLKRDIDYTINYDIGQITFINQQALNPAANVTIDFEYAPFFMPEKKSLFGLAGQYKLLDNSNISLAAMYRSETASDPRPRVGREPKRSFIWDSNFSFKFKPEFMTSLVDALPLVETDALSSLDFTGEVAQSFPNPNTKNEAYIDDFEGARNYTDLSTRRGMWTMSSPPIDSTRTALDLEKRTALWWYNPWDPVRITDIWPNRGEGVKEQENRIDVMFLKYFPDTSLAAPESSWAGIMRPLYTGLADQLLTKYIEIWYFPDSVDIIENPILNIDFGWISEDIDNDQWLDSEDRQTAGTARGVFEPGEEDTGLDTLFDAEEGATDLNPDPSGDDWHYSQNTPLDYSQINGTEGNAEDSDRRGRFDTEDINNNGGLDRQNGYFQYSVNLNNPQYLVDSTDTHWKLLRIPFQDREAYKVLGDSAQANFNSINYVRIWLTGTREPYELAIASFELVGNKWQELDIAYPEGDTVRPDEDFEVTVKNTHDNASYYPPPGVAGNLNRETGLREKEQSLVIQYENMPLGHVAGAAWSLMNFENYTQYGKLKMYVHGDTSLASGVPDGKVSFFLQLSTDGRNYYEYSTVLEPDWSENNKVELDFARLTELKYEMHRNNPDSLTTADTTDGHYSVYGNPSLSQVKWFIVGVRMAEDAPVPYTGEVWIDEMRVADIRRKSDFAGRIQMIAKFADFIDLNLSYSRTGADFYPLSALAPNGSTNTTKGASLNVRLDKLAPPSLGLSLPVTMSYTNRLDLPRLKTGSDIILRQELREFEKSDSKSYSLSFSESFNRNTKNWFWNSTLNRIRTGYTYSRTDNVSPVYPINRLDTFRGTGAYDLSPKSKPSFKPFLFAKYLFLPEKLYKSEMFYLPTQLAFSGEVSGSKSLQQSQRGIQTSSYVRDLVLSGNTTLNLFSTLRTTYSLNSNRDISQRDRFRLSINPSKLRLGQERTYQQRFETNFQPRLIQIIENRFTFSSSYAENADFRTNPDSTRTAQMNNTIKADLTFNIQSLFSSKGKAPRPPAQEQGKVEEPGEEPRAPDKKIIEPETEGDGSGPRAGSPKWVFDQFWKTVKSVKPIRGMYTKDKKLNSQGLLDRPSWRYLFGLTERTGVPSKTSTGLVGPNQSIYSDTYTLDSGLQPSRNLDITTSYSLRKTTTRTSTDPLATKSVTFPDIGVNLTGLEKVLFFKKISSSTGLQTSYSKKVDQNGRADTGELYKRDTARLWSPLAAVNITFLNNVRGTLRFDHSSTIQQNLRGEGQAKRDVLTSDNTVKLSLSYSFTAPKGLKLPFLRRVKFNSQLSVNLDITTRSTKGESITGGIKSVDSQRSQLIIEPRMTYQFSRAITGGVRARWDDSNDKIQKRKHHIRELGITAEIRF